MFGPDWRPSTFGLVTSPTVANGCGAARVDYICRIKMGRQLELPIRTHGGKRRGAGRKPRSGATVPHTARPALTEKLPVHVTLRVTREVWNLRSQRAFAHVEHALNEERRRGALRIAHYSVQGNHLHLIAETDDRPTLSRRVQGLTIRLAKALNRMMRRPRGRVFAERYHLHVLRTPREVKNALRYVLLNHVKHSAQTGRVGMTMDPFSSGPFFAHWPANVRRMRSACTGPPPIVEARSYLLTASCRRDLFQPTARNAASPSKGSGSGSSSLIS